MCLILDKPQEMATLCVPDRKPGAGFSGTGGGAIQLRCRAVRIRGAGARSFGNPGVSLALVLSFELLGGHPTGPEDSLAVG